MAKQGLEQGLVRYLHAAKNHNASYALELNELRDDLLADNFTARDYRASERLLQVYVELCIGLAKHWLKQSCQTTKLSIDKAVNRQSCLKVNGFAGDKQGHQCQLADSGKAHKQIENINIRQQHNVTHRWSVKSAQWYSQNR